MKRLYVLIVLVTLLLLLVITDTKADTITFTKLDSVQNLESAKVLLTRLDEINAMDKAGLTRSESKSFRKEVRTIKGELKELRKGRYIPVGKLVILLLVPLIVFNVTR